MKASRLTAVISCLVVTVALAADWPQWRGPNRNGLSAETGLLQSWPDSGPRQVWKVEDLGGGYSTPVVVDDRLYIVANQGVEDELVLALDAETGERVWSTRIGSVGKPDQRPSYPGARSTPTVDGSKLYVLGSDGDLACLDRHDGDVVWRVNVRTQFGGKSGTWAYSESPLVDGDVVVCAPGGSEATLVSLDKNSGEVIWKSAIAEADDAGYASTIIIEVDGIKQYVQFLSKGVVGVDAETGELLWRYNTTADGSPANIGTPVAKGELVYTAASRTGGGLVQLKVQDGQVTADEVYFNNRLPNAIGGALLVGDHLYGTSRRGLLCVEFASGKLVWQESSVGTASLLYADERLYLRGEDGSVILAEVSPDGYREHGRFKPAGQPNRSSGRLKAWAYPVVANGRLYVHDAGTLWCYDIRR